MPIETRFVKLGGFTLDQVTSMVITGSRDSGKTALSYGFLLESKKPVYVYKYPNPPLIKRIGFRPMYSIEELEDLVDSVIWIDEPQLHFPVDQKKANSNLAKLLSIAMHKDLTMLFTTSDTRWVTRGLESYIDAWAIKDIEASLAKQGSLIKRIITRNCIVSSDDFKLPQNKYLFYARKFPALEGIHKFMLPSFWSTEYRKPYR